MQQKIVSREEWLKARMAHLEREKEFTRLRDQLGRERRELPCLKVEKDYRFEGAQGEQSLSDLFHGRSQLITYHFMFGRDWEEGCPSCSFWADNFNGIVIHLAHRDVTMVAVSTAPFEKLAAYRERMGWSFDWLSSAETDFNQDFYVTFTPEQVAGNQVYYNYRDGNFSSEEAPGASVFLKDGGGDIFHTYSCYGRGLDMLNGAYHHLDICPKGRDEAALPFTLAWLRRHDQYQD